MKADSKKQQRRQKGMVNLCYPQKIGATNGKLPSSRKRTNRQLKPG